MDQSMDLTVGIHSRGADQTAADIGKVGQSFAGLEGVSVQAIANLTAAIEKLDLDFTKLGAGAENTAKHVRKVGTSAEESKTFLEDLNRVGGNSARMYGALGSAAGEATGRIEALTGTLAEMGGMLPEVVAIGAAFGVLFSEFEFVKDGVQGAANLQVAMDQLRAVVDEQGKSWGAASEELNKFIETEAMASGIAETELGSALASLAGRIHDVHDAEVMLRVAEEEHIATGKSLEEVTNALLEAESGRGQTLAMLDPRLKNLIHDHANLHQILMVLHEDNRKAMEDANNSNLAWARDRVALEAMGEVIGNDLLPVMQYLAEAFVGALKVAEDLGHWMSDTFKADVMPFIDDAKAVVEAVMGVWAALHGDTKTGGKDLAAAEKDLKAIWTDSGAGANFMADAVKTLNDVLHMHAIGIKEVDDAIKQHEATMNSFSLDMNPTVGFGTGKKSGHGAHAGSHAGKGAIDTMGGTTAVVQYDDSIKMTTRDQNAFTSALYATGDALGKNIEAMQKSIEQNQQRNEDERATYGKSIQEQIAYYQQKLAYTQQYESENTALIAEYTNKIADLQTKEYEQEYDAAKKAHDDQVTLIKDWADKGVTLFNTFFENGKAGFKSFADAFKKMLEDMLVALEKSELARLLAKIFGVDLGGGFSFGGGSASSGGLSSAGTLASLLGVGSSSYASSSIAGQMASAGTLSSIGSGSVGASSGSGGGSGLMGLGGNIGWGTKVGGATLGNYALAATGGYLIGQYQFGGKGYADVGGAIGGTAGLYFGGPIGAFVGAEAGAFLGSLFGNHFNPANEPDIYQKDAWGQQNADMTGGEWTASGTQYYPDSWTKQLTKGKGWNIVMENFVNKFRGKEKNLPPALQQAFAGIEALWGGANGQANFNNNGKDGNLQIGSGKFTKWSEFWSYVQSYGPQIAQLMDNYQPSNAYNASNGMASLAGSFSPDGNPYILHSFPDYPGSSISPAPSSAAPVSGGGGGFSSGGGSGSLPGGGGVAGGGGNARAQSVNVTVNLGGVHGSLIHQGDLANYLSTILADHMRMSFS